MAGSREPLVIGPFAGGLNTYDDATAIKDSEVVECLNFDPGLDGSLKSRPPFQDLDKPMTLGASGGMRFLGFFYTAGGYYLIASNDLTTQAFNGTTWQTVTSTIAATAMVQFDNKAWLLASPSSADPGGYWSPSGGFVADAEMPRGDAIVSYKSRLWIAPGKGAPNATRVYYSKVLGQPSFWASPAFVDVGQGDGQEIITLTTYYNQLIAFRTQSIYAFNYSSDPAQGSVSLLVPGIGLTSKECLVSFENYLYFMYDEKAYQFINNGAQQINLKVPFTAITKSGIATPFAVSVFNNRIVYHYYDTMYVFSMRTKTWTRWRSQQHGTISQIMSPSGVLTDEAYVNAPNATYTSGGTRYGRLLFIADRFGNEIENYICEIRTKNYSYQLTSSHKRLFWWGVDAVFRGRIRAWAIPVVANASTTWGTLYSQGVTWGQLATWGSPFLGDISVETDYNLEQPGPMRKFVKMFKSFRFRQVGFRVLFYTDGSIGTAPVNLFTITAFVGSKQTVSKTVT